MSKLNAVRIINLIYNHKTIHINDLLFEFNGKTTLINLENGAGKSVLTQMITSVNVTEGARDTDARKFVEYFPTTRPTFILEEYKLEQDAGYMMCGFMVRKNPNYGKEGAANDKELEILGLVSEYSSPCEQDIRHLPVTEERDGKLILKSFATCGQIFEGYKKDSRCRFFVYKMSASGAQARYLEKLAENGVYSGEWKNIIKKANTGEEEKSGLAGMFKDCKNERGLIEKWFLPAVEGCLSRDRDKNFMKNFRETVAKYIRECFQNDEKIRTKSSIEHFLSTADGVVNAARDYQSAFNEQDRQRDRIACFSIRLGQLAENAAHTQKREESAAAETAGKIRETEHGRLSMEHAAKTDELRKTQAKLDGLRKQIEGFEKDKDIYRHSLNVLKLAEKQGYVNTAVFEVRQKEQALEIRRRAEEDLKPEKNYIGYRLRCLYKEKDDRLAEETARLTGLYAAALSSKNTAAAKRAAAEDGLNRQNKLLGALNARVRGYDEKESRYVKMWHRALSRNLFGVYADGTLDGLTALVNRDIASHQKELEEKKRAKASASEDLAQARDLKDRLRDELHELADTLTGEEARLSDLSEQLQYRRKALMYLDLGEEALYDKEAVLTAAGQKISEIERIIGRLTMETEQLRESVRIMKTGKISGIQKELKDELERLGINIVYGMEWLKKNGKSEEENLAMVRKNPFLPYSLIMTNKEAERLSASDRRVYTSMPVPIVTREALASAQDHISDIGGVRFYMYFNESLLNEERLKKLIAEKENLIREKEDETETHRQEHHEYIARRDRILVQDVTREAIEMSHEAAELTKEKIQNANDRLSDVRDRIPALEKEQKDLDGQIEKLNLLLVANNNEKAELAELEKAYLSYEKDMTLLSECGDKIETLKKDKDAADKEYRNAEQQLRQIDTSRSDIKREKDALTAEAAEFKGYEETVPPNGFDDSMKNDGRMLLARYRAITENASAEEKRILRELEGAQKKLTKEQRGLESLAKRYGLQEPDWIDWHYDAGEEEKTESLLMQAEDDLKTAEKERGTVREKIVSLEKDCAHILSEMERICGNAVPMPEDEIPRIDFAERKRVLETEKKGHEDAAQKAEKKCDGISSTQKLFAEYEGIEPAEIIEFEEDLDAFETPELQAYAVGLIKQIRLLEKDAARKKEAVEKLIRKAKDDSLLQDRYFRTPIETLLSITDDPNNLLRQLMVLQRSYTGTLDKLKVDIEFMAKNKKHIADTLEEYVERVHIHMNRIDKSATILIKDKPVKMLKIALSDWEENRGKYRLNLERYIDELTAQGVALLKAGNEIGSALEKTMTTKSLFDNVVGIETVKITLYKVESNGGKVLPWEEAAKNSGGEGTLSAFAIATSLISYTRSRDTDVLAEKNEGKILILDNPFGSTSSEHLLTPMFQLAEKNNIQLVCFSAHSDAAITNNFDNIYSVDKIPSTIGNTEYMVAKHIKGSEPEDLLTMKIEVTDSYEQVSLF